MAQVGYIKKCFDPALALVAYFVINVMGSAGLKHNIEPISLRAQPNNSLQRSANPQAFICEALLLLRLTAPAEFERWAALLKGFDMAANSL